MEADRFAGIKINQHCYNRLERLHVNDLVEGDSLKTDAVVQSYEYYGLYIKYSLKVQNHILKVIEKNSGKPLYQIGDKVTLSFNPNDIMQYGGDKV